MAKKKKKKKLVSSENYCISVAIFFWEMMLYMSPKAHKYDKNSAISADLNRKEKERELCICRTNMNLE